MARIGLGFVDQALASASNVLVVFAIARTSSVDEFGAFSLALFALTATVAGTRGLLGAPIALLSDAPNKLRSETAHALAAAAMAGVGSSLIIAAVALLTQASTPTYILALAAPFVVVQDVGRFFCISSMRVWCAVLSDGVWTVGSSLLLLMTVLRPERMPGGVIIGGWGCLAVVAMFAILVPSRLLPTFTGLGTWWKNTFSDRLRFGAEALTGAASSLLVLAIATAIIGVAATAALRGAGTVFGPLNIVVSAIPLAIIPELRRRGFTDAVSVWRPLRKIAIPMSAFALALGGLSLAVPAAWGYAMLGDSWTVVRPLLPITGSEYAAVAWLSAASGGILAQARSSHLLRLRLVFAVFSIVLGSLGAFVLRSPLAVAAGLAVSAILAATYAIAMLFRVSTLWF